MKVSLGYRASLRLARAHKPLPQKSKTNKHKQKARTNNFKLKSYGFWFLLVSTLETKLVCVAQTGFELKSLPQPLKR